MPYDRRYKLRFDHSQNQRPYYLRRRWVRSSQLVPESRSCGLPRRRELLRDIASQTHPLPQNSSRCGPSYSGMWPIIRFLDVPLDMEPPVLWCLLYVRSSRHRYLDRTRHAVRSGLKRHLALGLLTYTNSIHFSRPNSYFPSQILLDLVAMSTEFSNCMESVPRFMQRNFLIRKCGAGSVSPFIIPINTQFIRRNKS